MIKTQVVVNKKTEEIICIAENYGETYDFKLYKYTISACILDSIKEQMDSRYQGVSAIHKNSETPKKKSKAGELIKEEKFENRRISREQIHIKNVNAKIKGFKIMANKYHNHRKHHKLRANLIWVLLILKLEFSFREGLNYLTKLSLLVSMFW